jgi:hypothetical protein
MRTALVLLFLTTLFLTTFFTTVAFAQDSAAISAAEVACGPKGVNFDVKDDNSQHTVAQPPAGKATVYVIQEIGETACFGGCLTTKIAVDGAWMGANHHNSYLFFAVEPGERHLCTSWQSRFERMSRVVGLAHFTAEAGKVYFFRTRVIGHQGPTFFDFEPIDSDQGKLFVASIPMSISHPKK